MPKARLVLYGRTFASQVVDATRSRIQEWDVALHAPVGGRARLLVNLRDAVCGRRDMGVYGPGCR